MSMAPPEGPSSERGFESRYSRVGVELLIDGLRPYAPEGERSEGEKGTERHA